jgi:hypothetical protein
MGQQDKIMRYSMELSLLLQLLETQQITESEYQIIKQELMKEYHILSDLTAMTA